MRHGLIGLFIHGREHLIDRQFATRHFPLITSSGDLEVGLLAQIRESECLIRELEERLGSPSATGTRATGTRI
jgi:hypothetical protein